MTVFFITFKLRKFKIFFVHTSKSTMYNVYRKLFEHLINIKEMSSKVVIICLLSLHCSPINKCFCL